MLKAKFVVEGILPERALLRLKRAGISVYNAKKIAKNRIVFSLKKKDCEKAFAIFPKVCYNNPDGEGNETPLERAKNVKNAKNTAENAAQSVSQPSAYTLKRIGANAPLRAVEFLKKRWGVLVGAAVFLGVTAWFQNYAFRIEIVGTDCYKREILTALDEGGIAVFRPYQTERIDAVCSKILALDGVGYCSVKKRGTVVTVEVRFDPFTERKEEKKPLISEHTGVLEELTVLRGAPLKKAGDAVAVGEPIVADYFVIGGDWGEEPKRVDTVPVARARIACVYEATVFAGDETQAFAEGYLSIALSPRGKIKARSVEKIGDGEYKVRIEYVEIQTVNF
ncbi:MAG: sporulation protein YqfD [Clostridia bacterium]|nr:sporulation protein YqfD [Clostridia bacterium]